MNTPLLTALWSLLFLIPVLVFLVNKYRRPSPYRLRVEKRPKKKQISPAD